MQYVKCKEEESTHVRIIDTEDNRHHATSSDVTIGEVYEILRNDDPGFEGEEMIKSDTGYYLCSFSLWLDVDWLKESN